MCRDYKDYKAQDDKAIFGKSLVVLLLLLIFTGFAIVSTADYNECMAGNKSVALCGGGNTK